MVYFLISICYEIIKSIYIYKRLTVTKVKSINLTRNKHVSLTSYKLVIFSL